MHSDTLGQRMLRYGLAILAVGVALGIILTIDPGDDSAFYAAVVVSAWFGGLGPGLLATVIAGALSVFFVVTDTALSVRIGADDVVRIIVLLAVALVINYLQSITRRARAEADAANRAKTEFLALLSHELRNPLNPVLAIATLHENDANASPELREDAATIRKSVELQLRLINDLLDMNRIIAGKLSVIHQDVDLEAVLAQAVSIAREDFSSKQINVRLDLQAREHHVEGDSARLQQVFWNILKNAAKFTSSGGAVCVASHNLDHQVVIEITDNGKGIDSATLPKIFNMFEQGGSDTTKKFGGLGIGLALSKMLVEMQGGTITAKSDGPGTGATFTVSLPVSIIHPCPDSAKRSFS